MTDWKPDPDFLGFLEELQSREGEPILDVNGNAALDEIRRGTPAGRAIYDRSHKELGDCNAFRSWKKNKASA